MSSQNTASYRATNTHTLILVGWVAISRTKHVCFDHDFDLDAVRWRTRAHVEIPQISTLQYITNWSNVPKSITILTVWGWQRWLSTFISTIHTCYWIIGNILFWFLPNIAF